MTFRRLSQGTSLARFGCSLRDTASVVLCARRNISHSFLAKTSAAVERWAARAQKIKDGQLKSAWDILQERGFIKDVAGHQKVIGELIRVKRIGTYVGVDPTADSMHIGHLVPLMALFWMWYYGHPAIILLGGSTARIGDPSGRSDNRPIMTNADISRCITKMHFQMSKLWFNADAMRRRFNVEDDWGAKHHLLNNNMWQQSLTMYDFNKRISRHVRIGPMLSRDWVKERLTNGSGMSFGEFMYPLLQGWDFWHLYNKLGVQMQIGGSDQFGNIITGIEALKIIRESEPAPDFKMAGGWLNEPCGFTTPLLTDANGNKFSKSGDASNVVWLDEFQTTPYNLYGYFVRQPDDQVERLLKLLTFIPLDEIQTIMKQHEADPTLRVAQHRLAFEVVCLSHGVERATREEKQHKLLKGEKLEDQEGDGKWTLDSVHPVTPNNAPQSDIELPYSVMDLAPGKILYAAGLAASASDGHRLTSNQGAYVAAAPGQERGLVPGNLSWTPMKMWFPGETKKYLIDDQLLILRKGKHNVRIVRLVSDEDWRASGKHYPGEAYTGIVRRLKEQIIQEAEARGETLSAKELAALLRSKVNLTVPNNEDIVMPRSPPRHKKPHWDG
ncbi:tyrosyl-trna synthetase [Ophiocordyceps camponoti-floridani]|uniref:Tyrosine--tRNA ligase n=1 Tax=Ophiocordyceps camponoti-floridani TaxID=2030778 RepID=A0A8H4QAV3_9HYPO|nr:tyrosyl-trna synthetase [Ophiocordyceps camponoti-floridani]